MSGDWGRRKGASERWEAPASHALKSVASDVTSAAMNTLNAYESYCGDA